MLAAIPVLATSAIVAARGGDRAEPVKVPHGPPSSFEWTPWPEARGASATIYRSEDGRRVAMAVREAGHFTYTYPFDEFLLVTSGTAKVSVRNGPSFELQPGHVAYFREGVTAEFELSEDFSDVAVLVSDLEIKLR